MKKLSLNESKLLWLSLPTFCLGLGYLLFYSQIWLGWWSADGKSSSLLSAMTYGVLIFGAGVGFRNLFDFFKLNFKEASPEQFDRRLSVVLNLALFGVLIVACFSALKPAHLIQESDFPNYHLLLPKQHWINGNWKPLEWSIFEFRSLLVQYGFSFLWIGAPLLNKAPQFLILLFLVLKILFLFSMLEVKRPYFAGVAAALCLFAFRGIEIQVGMAMLDLPAIYFLMSLVATFVLLQTQSTKAAGITSVLFGLDLTAYLAHKSFGVLFVFVLVFGTEALLRLLFQRSLRPNFSKLNLFLVAAPLVAIWLPNLYRSFYYTGDLFFPVFAALSKKFCDSSHLVQNNCDGIQRLVSFLQGMIGAYGYGHSLLVLPKAFINVATTRDGSTPVNNMFDYPLGYFWFLAWGLLGIMAVAKEKYRKPLLVVLLLGGMFFLVWFAGSQQSRWLYPVILYLALGMGYLLGNTVADGTTWKRMTVAVLSLTVIAVGVNGARVLRSQRASLGCFGEKCLALNQQYLQDYKTSCGAGPILTDDTNGRGYLPCSIKVNTIPF